MKYSFVLAALIGTSSQIKINKNLVMPSEIGGAAPTTPEKVEEPAVMKELPKDEPKSEKLTDKEIGEIQQKKKAELEEKNEKKKIKEVSK